ncbi:MAG: uroporphyrinogen decarboxylase family protein [Saccharofermentanales bacterium]
MMGRAKEKIARMRAALAHKETDRVPVGEFFWTGHMLKAKSKYGENFNPYREYDLDYIVMTPNLDPMIKDFEIVEINGDDIRLKTGFGATIRRSGTAAMPHYDSFSVKTPEEMASFKFDDPADPRRYFHSGDDQLNGVTDALVRNIPSWDSRVDDYVDDFAVFGSICECYEYLWRCIGTENAMYWMMEEPELFKDFVDRIGDFLVNALEAQIKAGNGRLSGMYIWGDVAYRNGMLFNPVSWREIFKPQLKRLIDICHRDDLMVVYHGCGNATPIYKDLIEIGLDAYNPLEVKADLDVVEIKKIYGNSLSFVGNVDVRALESGDPDTIKREVLYKLQAAAGGGWVFQSDHSISSDVSPESYKIAIEFLRKYGDYPLNMDEIRKELEILDSKK